jgi:hypothetical protein
VWSPARLKLTVRKTGSVAVRILPRSAKGNKARPLAVAIRGVATYRNPGTRGVYLYVEVRATARTAEYTLRLTAARR